MSSTLKLLTQTQLKSAIEALSHFELSTNSKKIMATFNFDTHVNALVFIAKITVHAEVAQHHPEITFTNKKVKVTLTTHESKGITKKDIALAKKIESIYER